MLNIQIVELGMVATATNSAGNLVRKQFFISNNQLEKLAMLSATKGKSEAEIVRLAIDAYDPENASPDSVPELLELLDNRLKEAIQSTQQANTLMANALNQLEQKS
jgi:hypothetical protein